MAFWFWSWNWSTLFSHLRAGPLPPHMSSVDLWRPSHTHCSLVCLCEAQGWICSHFPKWSLTPLYSFHERCFNTLEIFAFFFFFLFFLLLPGRTKVPTLRKGLRITWPFLGNCGEANVSNESACACSVTQSCPTLCDPMDYSPQSKNTAVSCLSLLLGIFQTQG